MERYKDLIHNNIQLFISNYLTDGALSEVCGLTDLEEPIYEKFPYMSIAYLLKANSLMDDYSQFIENHSSEIASEADYLRNIFGNFLHQSNCVSAKGVDEKLDDDKMSHLNTAQLSPKPESQNIVSIGLTEKATSTRIREEKPKEPSITQSQDDVSSRLIIVEDWRPNIFSVYDMNLNLLASDLRFIKGATRQYNPNYTQTNDYRIGYGAKDSMLYFMSGSLFTPLFHCEQKDFHKIRIVEYTVGSDKAFSIYVGESDIVDYVIKDGKPTALLEYLDQWCRSLSIPYFKHPLNNKLYSITDKSEVSIRGYIDVSYIGEDESGPLFFAKQSHNDYHGEIVRINGRKSYTLYTATAYPTMDKNVFVTLMTSGAISQEKYNIMCLRSIKDGSTLKEYWIAGGSFPSPYSLLPTGFHINGRIRYLKNQGIVEGVMNRIKCVNPHFYITDGIFGQKNLTPINDKEIQLYTSSDKPILRISKDTICLYSEYENLGMGYIAVKTEYDDGEPVILSPNGEIIYTLKEGEKIVKQKSERGRPEQSSLRNSEGGIIIKTDNGKYKVISYDGKTILEFRDNNMTLLGYHAGRVYLYDSETIGYIDADAQYIKIPWSKSMYFADVLSNGNIIIKESGKQYYYLIDIRGNVLMEGKGSIYVLE